MWKRQVESSRASCGSSSVRRSAVLHGFTSAEKGQKASIMAKEAVNAAAEMTLAEGLRFERRLFHALYDFEI